MADDYNPAAGLPTEVEKNVVGGDSEQGLIISESENTDGPRSSSSSVLAAISGGASTSTPSTSTAWPLVGLEHIDMEDAAPVPLIQQLTDLGIENDDAYTKIQTNVARADISMMHLPTQYAMEEIEDGDDAAPRPYAFVEFDDDPEQNEVTQMNTKVTQMNTIISSTNVAPSGDDSMAPMPPKPYAMEEIEDGTEPRPFNSAEAQTSAVLDNSAVDRSVAHLGIVFIPGQGFTGTETHSGYVSDPEDDNINEGGVILQGFLPKDDPSRRRNPRAESAGERIQRLIDNAITLDDSAVRPIPIEEDCDEEGNIDLEAARSHNSEVDDEEVKTGICRWFLLLLVIACTILAIALPVSLMRNSENPPLDSTASLSYAVCLRTGIDARFELAKSILSSITSPVLIEDKSTPQGKAIQWIVCHDSISVQLLENQDPSTGNLPTQKHGFIFSGDLGQAQVIRRYILATFFYSTSQVTPWKDSLNFLSPDLHECSWHKNYSRNNFPFGEWDPVGVFCRTEAEPYIRFDNEDDYSTLSHELNFRIDNNMNGPLPPETGHLVDCRSVMLENNWQLTGQLPQTIGNMTSLHSLSMLLNGPKFGGELPSSLFRLKNLNTILIEGNLGKEWSLPARVEVGDDTQLERLLLARNSFTGNIPSWIAQLNRLQTLHLESNNFNGAIPNAIGDLSAIKYINLMENNLTEAIPSTLGNLPAIEVLILGKNQLQGELPASIGNLRTLQLLDVGSNELTSVIPSSFANLESLKYLVLESNRFNGTVDVLESMKNLTILMIRSNSFSGALPDGLMSEASDNVVVDIGDNKFTDELPSRFANMSNLVSLIGAKNSFAANATQPAVCDNTELLVMDCGACECCDVCCNGEKDGVCDLHLDVRVILGYDCGAWFASCLQESGG